MRGISQLLLTFLLNASWQIVLITLAAALCAWCYVGWRPAIATCFG